MLYEWIASSLACTSPWANTSAAMNCALRTSEAQTLDTFQLAVAKLKQFFYRTVNVEILLYISARPERNLISKSYHMTYLISF